MCSSGWSQGSHHQPKDKSKIKQTPFRRSMTKGHGHHLRRRMSSHVDVEQQEIAVMRCKRYRNIGISYKCVWTQTTESVTSVHSGNGCKLREECWYLSRSTRSATLPLYTTPASKTEFARRSFLYVAPNIYLEPSTWQCYHMWQFYKFKKTTENLNYRAIFHVAGTQKRLRSNSIYGAI